MINNAYKRSSIHCALSEPRSDRKSTCGHWELTCNLNYFCVMFYGHMCVTRIHTLYTFAQCIFYLMGLVFDLVFTSSFVALDLGLLVLAAPSFLRHLLAQTASRYVKLHVCSRRLHCWLVLVLLSEAKTCTNTAVGQAPWALGPVLTPFRMGHIFSQTSIQSMFYLMDLLFDLMPFFRSRSWIPGFGPLFLSHVLPQTWSKWRFLV